jgi:hypothetical protein
MRTEVITKAMLDMTMPMMMTVMTMTMVVVVTVMMVKLVATRLQCLKRWWMKSRG